RSFFGRFTSKESAVSLPVSRRHISPWASEGDGLQPVRKSLKTGTALAAEGTLDRTLQPTTRFSRNQARSVPSNSLWAKLGYWSTSLNLSQNRSQIAPQP